MVDTWRIRITRGQVYREGQLGHHERAQGIIQMCNKFKHELPDMIIGYNGHDGARINIGWEERMRLEDLIEDGVEDPYLPKDSEMAPIMESPPPGWGIPQTCPIGSAMRQNDFVFLDPDMTATGFEIPTPPPGAIGSLIGGFKEYLDVCESPQYRHYHASTSWSYRESSPKVLHFEADVLFVQRHGRRQSCRCSHRASMRVSAMYTASSMNNSPMRPLKVSPGTSELETKPFGEVRHLAPSTNRVHLGDPRSDPACICKRTVRMVAEVSLCPTKTALLAGRLSKTPS